MVQNDVVLLDNSDDTDNTYQFVLFCLTTSIQYMIMNGQKVHDTLDIILLFWTWATMKIILTCCVHPSGATHASSKIQN